MVRAQFHQTNDHLALKLEGRLVSARAVEVKSLVSRHFVPNGLLVDVSEVTYVDPVGEQLFLWLRDLQAKFVAKTCHAPLKETSNMSRIHSTQKKIAEAKRVSTLEIMVWFGHEHEALSRLALVITGDIRAAELSVCKARELVTNGAGPFPGRKQLTEWLKRVTIEAAITSSLHEIARCESRYRYLNCTHSEHLLNGNDSKLRQFRNLLLHIDPEIVIGELDPLARAVAILRTTGGASILDCILRLRLSLDTVLAANCRAMTWFAEKRTGLTDKAPTPRQKLEKP